jgi:serine/threonine protein kinase
MGTVWLASDEVLARDVAVKEIHWPAQLSDTERDNLRQRAMREAQTAARLDHPNIARVYDVIDDGRPWIVMQLIPYPSLRDVVLEDGPLPPQRAAQIGLGVLAAIRAAHDAGVLHRDVKPGNILLGPDDHPVLTDFGMAIADGSPTLTASGLLIGSPSYMAPERARGEPATPAADMWALGATLYAAVEGRPPFDREGALAVLTAVVSMDPDPSGHSGPLWPVISGLLRKDPARRLDAAGAQRLLGRVADGSAALESTAPMDDAGQASHTLTGLPFVDALGLPERELPEPEGTAGLPVVSREPEEPPGPQESAEREEPLGLQEPSEPDGPPGLDEPAGVPPEPEMPAEPEVLAEPEAVAEPEMSLELEAPAEPEMSREPEAAAEPEMSPELVAAAEPEALAEAGASAEAEGQPPVPAGPGRGGDLWPPRLSGRWLLAGAGGLAVAAAVALVVLLLPGTGPGQSQAAPPAKPSPSGSHPGARPTATGSASASARSSASAADGASNVLPAGFTWYHDPTGFAIGMPDGWHVSHQSHYVYIQDPDGSRFLIIDQTSQPQTNALEDWRQQEAARISTYSGYHRIKLQAVQYAQAEQAADWEWTYYDSGRLTQVLNRNILVDSHQAYALYWSTPQAQWQASYHYFQTFAATFHPVGVASPDG